MKKLHAIKFMIIKHLASNHSNEFLLCSKLCIFFCFEIIFRKSMHEAPLFFFSSSSKSFNKLSSKRKINFAFGNNCEGNFHSIFSTPKRETRGWQCETHLRNFEDNFLCDVFGNCSAQMQNFPSGISNFPEAVLTSFTKLRLWISDKKLQEADRRRNFDLLLLRRWKRRLTDDVRTFVEHLMSNISTIQL